jgi:hypothetical protein
LRTAKNRLRGQARKRPAGRCARRRLLRCRSPEVLVVRVHVFESVGGRKLFVFDRQLHQKRRTAVEPPPFGKADTAVIDLAGFQLRLRPAAAARPITGVFRDAAFLDGKERQVELGVGLPGGGGEHCRRRGVGSL